jgi:hypothetical protein
MPICADSLALGRRLPATFSVHEISQKRCGWTRSSHLPGRCCQPWNARLPHGDSSTNDRASEEHGRQPKPRLSSPISASRIDQGLLPLRLPEGIRRRGALFGRRVSSCPTATDSWSLAYVARREAAGPSELFNEADGSIHATLTLLLPARASL